jgi:putative phosphoesterase
MRVGIISDTHGRRGAVQTALDVMGQIDALIHLGDHCTDADDDALERRLPLYTVKGNCDFTSGVELERMITLGGKRLLLTHGHFFSVKFGLDELVEHAKLLGADIALFGHTHEPLLQASGNLILLNPGSASRPRAGTPACCAVLKIENDDIIPQLIKLR